jgi:hypothetical protein
MVNAPKKLHDRRCEDNETQGHNTGSPFVPLHIQENNITENEARVWCVHEARVKQNRQNQRHEDGDMKGQSQTTTRKECSYQG